MIKKVILFSTAAVLAVVVAACSIFTDTTQKYLFAYKNTNNADTLQSKTECKIKIDLSKASEKIKKDLAQYEEINLNIDQIIDNRNKKSETSEFISSGDIVINTKVYSDGDNIYMKSPFYGDKYIRLNSKSQDVSPDFYNQYDELTGELGIIWKDHVSKEIMTSEGNTVENTPDGDIKVKQLSLQLTDEKCKRIIARLVEFLAANDNLKKMLIDNGVSFSEDTKSKEEIKRNIEEWVENLPENLEKNKDKYHFEKLKLTAKIDKDSYIIDETFEGILVINYNGETRISFNMNTVRWNINNDKLEVELPEIKPEELVDINDFNASESEFIKKLYNK